jgi:PPOX class probable F420-dependent enzyme
MDVTGEKYVLFTTFRRDGTPVSTPVWCAPLDGGRFGFWTSSGSGKAKRLAHDSRVQVQPCNGRGKPKAGTTPATATAELVTGTALEDIRAKIVAKYGVLTKITRWLNSFGNLVRRRDLAYGDRGVIVTPDASARQAPTQPS